MKKILLLILVFPIGFFQIIYSQKIQNNKYGANTLFESKKKKSSKENLIDCINYYKQNFDGKTPFCSFYNNSNTGTNCNELPNLKDTIVDIYEFIESIRMPKSYLVLGGKVRKIASYKLLFEDSNKNMIQIFSINHRDNKCLNLKIGEKYKLKLISYFGKDTRCVYSGFTISLLIDNVWIQDVKIGGINTYLSPNIISRCYVEIEN